MTVCTIVTGISQRFRFLGNQIKINKMRKIGVANLGFIYNYHCFPLDELSIYGHLLIIFF